MPQSAGTSMLHQPPSIQERLLDNASQGPAVDLIPSSAATIASSRGDHRFRRKRSAMQHWPWKHRAEMPNVRPCPITAVRREGKLTVGEGALTWAGYEHPDERSFHPIADFHHVLHRSYSHGYPQGLRHYSHPLLARRGSVNRHSDCASSSKVRYDVDGHGRAVQHPACVARKTGRREQVFNPRTAI